MKRVVPVVLAVLAVSPRPVGAQEVLEGTWKLIASTRTDAATGATVNTFGPNPQGYIMYGRDGRMMVLIAQGDRPRADRVEAITDQQRQRLFSTMMAYTGTYTFDGKTIEHHIDVSWNGVWNGTTQARDVRREGDRLIYTTKPSPSPVDGSIGFATVTWEKVK